MSILKFVKIILVINITFIITLGCKEIDKEKCLLIEKILSDPDNIENIVKDNGFYTEKWIGDRETDYKLYSEIIKNEFQDYSYFGDKKIAKETDWEITHFHHIIGIENDENDKLFFVFESKKRTGPWFLVRINTFGWLRRPY